MFRRVRQISILACSIWVAAVSAYADPIQVTAGRAFMYWDGTGANAMLLGSGLSVHADTYNGGLIGFAPPTATLDGGVTFGTLGGMQHTWSVTVDGTSYVAFLTGFLTFDTAPFDVPRPSANSGDVTFTTPFVMTGRLRGSTEALGGGSVLFDVDLAGIGTASTTARPAGPGYLVNGGVTYDFAAASAATPEPATLLLMGSGVAGVLLRRRRCD